MTITPDKTKKIHTIYSIILSICIIIAGICLITACVGIYRLGDHPFSREAVGVAFSKIAVPVYLCLILTVIGFIIDIVSSTSSAKIKPIKSYDTILEGLYFKRNIEKCDDGLKADIDALKHKRKILCIVNICITVFCSIAFLFYALNNDNFHQTNINGSIINAMYVLIPCLFISFGFTIFTLYYNEKSMKSELELLKKAPVKNTVNLETVKNETIRNSQSSSDNNTANGRLTKVTITRCVILTIGIFLLIYGFITGGTLDVLTKAVNICTECIGLG